MTRQAAVINGHGALPRDLAATQRRTGGLVTRRAAQRAERAALDNPAGAATHLVASATHHQQPDPSQKLDTGQGVSSARSSARASAAGGFARLPVPLRGLVSGTLGRSDRAFWVRRAGAGFVLVNGAQGFSARFSDSGVRVSARGGHLALSLAGVGYGSSFRPLGSRPPSADRNRVSYADRALTQWYENGPLGLEQGFTLRAPPPAGAARGRVTVALRGRVAEGAFGWWRRGGRFHRPGRGSRASLRGSAGG